MRWVLVVAALVLALSGIGSRAHAQTLLVEKFDDADSAPAGWTVLFATSAENSGGDQFCFDSIDNDLNGLIDCADPACVRVCGKQAPALSAGLTIVLGVLLSVLGVILARRRRKQGST